MKSYWLIFLFCFLLAACAEQRGINETKIEKITENNTNTSVLALSQKTSISELLAEAENSNSTEGFNKSPFCSLETYLGGKKNLHRLRNLWLQNENDSRYRLVTKKDFTYNTDGWNNYCVCPGVCVVQVVDTEKPSPKNFGIVVFSENLKKGYSWVMRDVDLSNAWLSWSSSTPSISKVNQDGSPIVDENGKIDMCWIKWSSKANKYTCISY